MKKILLAASFAAASMFAVSAFAAQPGQTANTTPRPLHLSDATSHLSSPTPWAKPQHSLLQKTNYYVDVYGVTYGNVCRNGGLWCVPGGWAPVGSPCMCPGFYGQASTW